MPEGGERNRIYAAFEDGTCPTAGCDARTGRGQFMCRACWRAVPDLLKSELREAARATRGPDEWDAFQRWLGSAVEALRVVEAAGAEETHA